MMKRTISKTLVIKDESETFSTVNDKLRAKNIYRRVIAKTQIELKVSLGFLELDSFLKKKDNSLEDDERLKRLGIDNAQECFQNAVNLLQEAKDWLGVYKASLSIKQPNPNEVKQE